MSAIPRIEDEPTKVCAQCKHYTEVRGSLLPMASRYRCNVSVHIVSGGPRLCIDVRGIRGAGESDGQKPICGPRGDLWEAK